MATPTTLSEVTVQDVKDYFGVTDTSKNSRISAMLQRAIDFITEYCNVDFEVKSRTEVINVDPQTTSFFLTYRPITSVTSIVEDGTTLVQDTDYFVDKVTGKVDKLQSELGSNDLYNRGIYWTTKKNVITVTYTAGKALKQDVVLVMLELVGIYAGDINQKVFVDVEGQQTATNYDMMPKELYNILDRYKQKVTVV